MTDDRPVHGKLGSFAWQAMTTTTGIGPGWITIWDSYEQPRSGSVTARTEVEIEDLWRVVRRARRMTWPVVGWVVKLIARDGEVYYPHQLEPQNLTTYRRNARVFHSLDDARARAKREPIRAVFLRVRRKPA